MTYFFEKHRTRLNHSRVFGHAALVVVLGLPTLAAAQEGLPPSWSSNPGSARQFWFFESGNSDGPEPDSLTNPNGFPSLLVTGGTWVANWSTRTGLWRLPYPGSSLEFTIPSAGPSTGATEVFVVFLYWAGFPRPITRVVSGDNGEPLTLLRSAEGYTDAWHWADTTWRLNRCTSSLIVRITPYPYEQGGLVDLVKIYSSNCIGPTATDETTWGTVKALFR